MKTQRKLWFRAKTYGWGWYPITWQGWAVTIGYTVLFIGSTIAFTAWLGLATEAEAEGRSYVLATAEFVLWLVLLTAVLIRICYRTGERPTWRWGKK